MATVTGLTAARMEAIEAMSVVDAELSGDNLILKRFNETTIDVGNVRGPMGEVTSEELDATRINPAIVRRLLIQNPHDGGWTHVVSGTGAKIVQDLSPLTVDAETGRSSLQTGTTDSGSAKLIWGEPTNIGSVRFLENDTFVFRASIRITTALSDVDNRYTVSLGLATNAAGQTNPMPGTAPEGALAFQYSDNLSSGNWRFVHTTTDENYTVIDTGVGVSTNTVYWLEYVYDPSGRVRVYINGTLVATITTFIPFDVRMLPFLSCYKSTGTTNRTWNFHWVELTWIRSGANDSAFPKGSLILPPE